MERDAPLLAVSPEVEALRVGERVMLGELVLEGHFDGEVETEAEVLRAADLLLVGEAERHLLAEEEAEGKGTWWL